MDIQTARVHTHIMTKLCIQESLIARSESNEPDYSTRDAKLLRVYSAEVTRAIYSDFANLVIIITYQPYQSDAGLAIPYLD